MSKILKNNTIFVLLFLLAACGSSQKAVYAPGELAPKEQSLLWKISGNGLKKPSYLYGTIHLIPKDQFVLTESTREAFDDSERVVFEIDMKEMTNLRTQFKLMSKAFMAGGKTLRDLLPAEDYAFVHAKIEETGIPASMLERLKPLFVSSMLTGDSEGGMGAADSRMTSVEMELYRMARRRRFETGGLETAEYQMSVFDSIPYEAQAKMLLQTLRSSSGDSDGEFEKMLELYRNQDIQGMQSMLQEEGYGIDQYENLLLTNRNENWIPIMDRLMREKPTFFAVGAGHLGGERGVVALLRKAGYRVSAAPPVPPMRGGDKG